jgi:hypothetical protein
MQCSLQLATKLPICSSIPLYRFSQEWEDTSLPVPRLASLYLSSTGGCRIISPAADSHCDGPVAAATAEGFAPAAGPVTGGAEAGDEQPSDRSQGASAATDVLAPTLISNWHFLHVISHQVTLSHLSLHDTAEEPGGAWRELPSRAKLRSRALSLLSHLKELTSLDLQVSKLNPLGVEWFAVTPVNLPARRSPWFYQILWLSVVQGMGPLECLQPPLD